MPFLHRFTSFLKEAGPSGWFVGDSVCNSKCRRKVSTSISSFQMTWADIVIGDYVERLESLYEPGITKEFPELKKHQERVYQNPGIAKRIVSRPDWKL